MVAAGKDYSIQVNHDDTVSVNIGRPSIGKRVIGLSKEIANPLDLNLKIDLRIDDNLFAGLNVLRAACVSVGNPHLTVFVNEIPPVERVSEIGKILSINDLFANRINVSFAHVISDALIKQSSYERGTGITLACGSGACATAFLARKCGFVTGNKITVQQSGGALSIIFNDDESVMQTGKASYVFSGKITI
jgi:diaminopimelate epimerase